MARYAGDCSAPPTPFSPTHTHTPPPPPCGLCFCPKVTLFFLGIVGLVPCFPFSVRFVRGIGTDLGSQRMFFGTLSAKLIYSGRPHLWIRTQMPQGNWMVNRPVMMTMMNHIANGTCYMPYMGYVRPDRILMVPSVGSTGLVP